jgi:molecular chaperone HtpG
MLQESRAVTQIEQMITKQVIKSLRELSEEQPDKYKTFWSLFGKVLKEGVSTDWKNKDALVSLCRFESMNTPEGQLLSLSDYVKAMPEGQTNIYYLTGLARRAVAASPHLEAFKKKGYDVLFLTDPIDEWVVQSVTEFEKKRLTSVAHGDLDLGLDTKADEETAKPALAAIRQALGDRVVEVRFSTRLTDSPSCLVSAPGDPGANMERLLRMMDERTEEKKRVLEINPAHPVIQNLAKLALADMASPRLALYCETLYDQALLAEGVVAEPQDLVKRLSALLAEATGKG